MLVSDSRTPSQLANEVDEFPDVEFVLGGHPESLLDGADLLCLSGSVPLELPIVQEAIRRKIPISNDAQLFLERCPAPVIGITGSAGKTTTTTLTGEIMKRAGYTTWVGGNIGNVLLDVLPQIKRDHFVVMELSSFQLEIMSVSPPTAAVLNITPNHLDRHGTMDAYAAAKAHIVYFQESDDIAVLGYDDAGSRSLESIAPGEVVWFSGRDMIANGTFLAGERLLIVGRASYDGDPHVICERAEVPLRGDHNVLNVLAACAITGVNGVLPEIMAETIRDFKAVTHRLETVRVLNGVTYVNDSIATAPERVVAALHSYHEPLVLLLGGRDKKLPWDDMIRLALSKARHIIAFGEAADLVVEVINRIAGNTDDATRVQTLEEAVAKAASVAQSGDVVLLSPGGTSYDTYVDFAARGEHFRQLVLAL